jgi:hypothetical protein
MATVSYVPNDPLASGGPPTATVTARKFPPGDIARFNIKPVAVPGKYAPLTPEFDYWQAKLALISGLRNWKTLTGNFLPRWYGNKQALPVLTDSGDDLNAFYDRKSLQFFHHKYKGVTVHSAESVDIVCHEQGHAFLDAIRSDFFEVPFIEVGAQHEAFGDCCALLVALEDKAVRDAVIAASPDLSAHQFVESLAEQLGDAIRREYGPDSVESGALRHALNTFKWTDPTHLPSSAPADKLCGEVHSFARVFVGAFYDVIRNIYNGGKKDSTGLRNASRTAGKLLIAALQTVPAAPRIFEGVGQRMVMADVTMHGGANTAAIKAAFAAHGMPLPAPVMSLPVPLAVTNGHAPRKGRSRVTSILREQLGVPNDAKIELTPVDSELHGAIAHVTAYRPLALDGDGLEGVRVLIPGIARVQMRGLGGPITGILGDVTPASGAVEDEARAFVRALVASGDVSAAPRAATRMMAPPQPQAQNPRKRTSHEIRIVGGQPTLVRVGFSHRG